jgi:hypothetical protein
MGSSTARQAMKRYPTAQLAPTWLKELSSLKPEHKKLIWQALWQADTTESQQAKCSYAQARHEGLPDSRTKTS